MVTWRYMLNLSKCRISLLWLFKHTKWMYTDEIIYLWYHKASILQWMFAEVKLFPIRDSNLMCSDKEKRKQHLRHLLYFAFPLKSEHWQSSWDTASPPKYIQSVLKQSFMKLYIKLFNWWYCWSSQGIWRSLCRRWFFLGSHRFCRSCKTQHQQLPRSTPEHHQNHPVNKEYYSLLVILFKIFKAFLYQLTFYINKEKSYLTEAFVAAITAGTDNIGRNTTPWLRACVQVYDRHIHHHQPINNSTTSLCETPSSYMAGFLFLNVHIRRRKGNDLFFVPGNFPRQLEMKKISK